VDEGEEVEEERDKLGDRGGPGEEGSAGVIPVVKELAVVVQH